MVEGLTSWVLGICVTVATIGVFICAATLAVASPWWPRRKRSGYGHGSSRTSTTAVNLLCRSIEAFALTSPRPISRARDASRKSSVYSDSQALPLRFQPERLYGSTSPRNSSARSSICSFNTASLPEYPTSAETNKINTIGGFLAPPTIRPRSGSMSLLHDLAKNDYVGMEPIPAFMATVNAQLKPNKDSLNSTRPTVVSKVDDAESLEKRRIQMALRRTTLGCLSPKPMKYELGVSLNELASMLGTQISRSTQNSPTRKRTFSSAASSPHITPPIHSEAMIPFITATEAPGGTINYRVFIDATGKNNLTVRVHLYHAAHLPATRPWKNSNYIVKATLSGFKSQFTQTSGIVTAACGSPRFTEAVPSVLDFVLDCGMPFNQSAETVKLELVILEFLTRKPREKAVVVARKDYAFSWSTLNGKSTLSTDIIWEPCTPCIDVYQLSADILTSLTQKESEGALRFEIQEIRNLTFRQLPEELVELNAGSKKSNLYPVKLRLRACLVTNGKATCIRKGFNIRLPQDFAKTVANRDATAVIVLKDHVFSSSELVLTFRPPLTSSLDRPEVYSKVGVHPVQWRILAYIVLILEDASGIPKRVRAIGSCCLGSNIANATSVDEGSMSTTGILPLLLSVASESSQCQVSQWLHVE